MSYRSENQEASGLGVVMLFMMPIAVAALLGVIAYLGSMVGGHV